MEPYLVGILGFLSLFLLMALGMPIGFSLGLMGFLGITYLQGVKAALSSVGMVPYSWACDYTFMCIPLFVLMGHFASESGIITRFFEAAHKWTGKMRGGLAVATSVASAGFAAVSGSSSAAAATMATICIPEMKKHNYEPKLMTGCVAVGGTLAILIPPSMGFVIYGIITGESIGKLFIAGIFPGLVMSALLCITILIMCRLNPSLAPAGESTSFKEKLASLIGIWEVIFIFICVIGGMYSGIFTPTEGASVGSFLTFLFALLKGNLSIENFVHGIKLTAQVTVMIFVLIIGAMIFNTFLAFTGIPDILKKFIMGLGANKYLVLAFILLTYFIAGCIMDAIAMSVLLLPIYYPIVIDLGFNGIWFGVVSVVMTEIGLLTPPIGLNCFVVHGVFPEYSLRTVFLGIAPFVVVDLITLLIIILLPQLSLYLPSLM